MCSRFPSSPLIIRVPFFLLFGFNKGTQKKKGKRVLLGHLVLVRTCINIRLRLTGPFGVYKL